MIGSKIKELRKEQEISQEQLAKAIGFSQAQVGKWENGKSDITSEAIKNIAIFFEVSTDYLLGLEDEAGARPQIAPDIKKLPQEYEAAINAIKKLDSKQVYKILGYIQGMTETEIEKII